MLFFLRQRCAQRYGADIRPGHPLYERVSREVLEQQRAEASVDEESVLETLNAKIDAMRRREAEVPAMLREDEGD